jgi:hypothetical protein
LTMKNIRYKIEVALIIMLMLFACNGGFSQTYNPTQGTVSNKPYAPAQATPTDSRSYFYDVTNFLWRPYQSTTEVLSYLNLTKYRVGQFSIYINPTGTLNPDGTFTGGTLAEYWFKNGTTNSHLVLKTDSTKANQSAFTDSMSTHRTLINTKANQVALVDSASALRTAINAITPIPVSITATTGTHVSVSPSPITGTGVISLDTTKLTTRDRLYKTIDSIAAEQDTLIVSNISTTGLGLVYSNTANDTLFSKRIKSGSGTTVVQNSDSSIQVNFGGTLTATNSLYIPGSYTQTMSTDSTSLHLARNIAYLDMTSGLGQATFELSKYFSKPSSVLTVTGNGATLIERSHLGQGLAVSAGRVTSGGTDSSSVYEIYTEGVDVGVTKKSSIKMSPSIITFNAYDSVVFGKDTSFAKHIRVGYGVSTPILSPWQFTSKEYVDSMVSTGGEGSGNTDLSTTQSEATTVTINSNTGTDATIVAATSSVAGIMTATDKLRLDSTQTLEDPAGTGYSIVDFPSAERAVFKKLKFAGSGWTITNSSDSINIVYAPGAGTVELTGDITGTGTSPIATTLAASGASAGTYGSSTLIPVLTVNAKGLITSISATAAAGGIGETNLSATYDTDDFTIVSSSGVDVIVDRATSGVAGAFGSTDFNRLWQTFYVANSGVGDSTLYAIGDTMFARGLSITAGSGITVDTTGGSLEERVVTVTSANLVSTATIDFSPISAQTRASDTHTVSGAAVGDAVLITPLTADIAGVTWYGRVTSTDTVTIYGNNFTGSPVDPPSGTFKVIVFK